MGIDRLQDDDAPLAAMDAAESETNKTAPDGLGEADVTAANVMDRQSAVEPDVHGDRNRVAASAEYQATVDAIYQAAARERWEAAKPEFRDEWIRYAQNHPAPLDASANIDEAAITSVRRGCERIREIEEKIVTPATLRIEADDPDRHLVGLKFRCKDEDRIMEKVAAALEEQSDLTPEEALASVKDAIRYTFQYTEEHYTEGVYADIDRLKDAGFELVELRNSWGCEEYKGINSRWRVPGSGQLFELQFHTQISFEAKQLTHPAYERIRNPATPHAELRELRAFQRMVNAEVPNPSRAMDIPTYP